MWLLTTLDGEGYEWYRDHDEKHFQTWDQLQQEFLNEFRPEVGQSMAFRALMTMRQRRDKEISTYSRKFDLVCAMYVGTLLNDDILMQFFMKGFVKANIIRGVLERNPRTIAEAKVAARNMKHIERDYERLWRKDDELITQFIPLLPKSEVDPIRPLNCPPYVSIETVSLPLAVEAPPPMLVLPAPRTDHQIEEVEQCLGATQLGF